MRLPIFPFALCALCACAPPTQVSKGGPVVDAGIGFGDPSLRAVAAVSGRSSSLTRDFMDLTFALESGQDIEVFTRFEGPITVTLAGDVPATAARDLAALVGRLQTEAGIDITTTTGPATITVEFASQAELRRLAPRAACFVVPNAGSLADYRRLRGTPEVDWARITRRDRAAVFIPTDTSPQEVRDCLHEELAQALGPLNDLYRLPESVFNDDNFHSVLTSFDMDILRLYYSPSLTSGMTRSGVATRLSTTASRGVSTTPSAWIDAIESALGRTGSLPSRQAAADRALAIAVQLGWQDSRAAFSHFAVGRLSVGSAPEVSLIAFGRAAAIYARLPGGELQVAHIDMQLAAMALAGGHAAEAIQFADRAIPVVARYENAALLATLMLIKAEALERMGDAQAAAALRLDSQVWARYGFGPDSVVKARIRDIAAVADRGAKG